MKLIFMINEMSSGEHGQQEQTNSNCLKILTENKNISLNEFSGAEHEPSDERRPDFGKAFSIEHNICWKLTNYF